MFVYNTSKHQKCCSISFLSITCWNSQYLLLILAKASVTFPSFHMEFIHGRHMYTFCRNSSQASLTSCVFPQLRPWWHWPCSADDEAATSPLHTVLVESNGAVNCQPITQLFPLCGASWQVTLVPWPVTSGEQVKCSVWSQQCRLCLPPMFSQSSHHCPLHFQTTGHLQCINDTSHHRRHVACQTSYSLGLT